MRVPLMRQGEGPAAAYERHRQQREADRAKLEQITRDSAHIINHGPPILSRLGDEEQLRGVPVQTKGISGAMRGTRPTDCIR